MCISMIGNLVSFAYLIIIFVTLFFLLAWSDLLVILLIYFQMSSPSVACLPSFPSLSLPFMCILSKVCWKPHFEHIFTDPLEKKWQNEEFHNAWNRLTTVMDLNITKRKTYFAWWYATGGVHHSLDNLLALHNEAFHLTASLQTTWGMDGHVK